MDAAAMRHFFVKKSRLTAITDLLLYSGAQSSQSKEKEKP
jgi:hypothetical protein